MAVRSWYHHTGQSNEVQISPLLPFGQITPSLFPQIGGKAISLVRLNAKKFPVPPGYCLPATAFDAYVQSHRLPAFVIAAITRVKRELGGKIAIRSSANCEDGTDISMAGVFRSHYVYNDADIRKAVVDIYTHARSKDVQKFMALHKKSATDVRMGLIVQQLIEPDIAGAVYTGLANDDVLIEYVDGFGSKLVDGEIQGSAVLVNRDGRIVQSSWYEQRPLPALLAKRIARIARSITRFYGNVPQDIEFAAKDAQVYIVQARTLTSAVNHIGFTETLKDTLKATKNQLNRLSAEETSALGTDQAIFSDSNYSELLPRPKEMDIGIHMYVWGGSDRIPGAKQIGHGRMGYLVGPEANPLIHFIGGKAYFSLARYAGVYHIGFPETKKDYYSVLVREYLDAVRKDPAKGSYPQMGLFLQDPTPEELRKRFGKKAPSYYKTYIAFADRMRRYATRYLAEFRSKRLPNTESFIEAIRRERITRLSGKQLVALATRILEHNRTESYVDFVLSARLGFYYSQRLQHLLAEALHITADEARKQYSRLNQGLDGSAITEVNIAISQAPSEQQALRIARRSMGHYSTGEMLEIRHTPMRDDPTRLLAYVRGIRQNGKYAEHFDTRKQARIDAEKDIILRVSPEKRNEFIRVMRASQTYMALRETAKYHFTREYLVLRDVLERIGTITGLENGAIYHLYPRELPEFITDPKAMLHIIRARTQAFENYPHLVLPSVITESDIAAIHLKEQSNASFTEENGKFLADGPAVTGVIVNADEFSHLREVNARINKYRKQHIPVILCAVQMNLSHDPLIYQSAGLILKNAGLVAHGAQRARELGKGAIGSINTRLLTTGMRVSFDPATATVKKI